MKPESIKKKIKALAEKCDKVVIDRENKFSARTENWQESENGEKYQEETNAISEAKDLLWESLECLP